MAQPVHPILPRLASGNKVKNFNRPGAWERRDANEVKSVAGGLDVPDRSFNAQSIPDVWARPLLFESALLAATESAQSRLALAEWRGLMAILGLRKLRGFSGLDFHPVFPNNSRPTGFMEVADKLRPDRLTDWRIEAQWVEVSISPATTWRQVSLIAMDDKSIGMTSPTTLVCTAAEYADRINQKQIPWMDKGRLTDPRRWLGRDEQHALAHWLHQIHEDLILQAKGRRWGRLSAAMVAFIQDLGGAEGAESKFVVEMDKRVAGSALVHLGAYVNHLASSSAPWECDVELGSTRKTAPPLRALILDEDLPRQWRKDSVAIRVLSALPLAGALNQIDPAHRDLIGSIHIPNGQWFNRQDFFTPRLHLFRSAGVLPGAFNTAGAEAIRWNGEPVTLVLPIRKKWLDWLTADQLRKRVSVSQERDSIVIKLILPLSGGDFMITREYDEETIEDMGIDLPPLVKVWPFLRATGWRSFYTYYDNREETEIVFSPWLHGELPATRAIRLPDTQDRHRMEISRTTSYPEAMVCELRGEEAGIVPLEQPKATVGAATMWRVGIDFGTTGTSIFYAAGSRDGQGRPVTLRARSKWITNPGPQDAVSVRRFLPNNDQDGGAILSIFHDFEVDDRERHVSGQVEPFIEGRIYFVEAQLFRAMEPGIYTNMKWGGEGDRARGKAFLKQLALQACAEAAAVGASSISWRFSFPTAFSPSDLQIFDDSWRQVVEYCAEMTGVSPAVDKESSSHYKRKNESVAAAHYFREVEKAPLLDGAVCIDIGGGTSDIVVWQESQIVAQASFRLAGRDIFLHPIFLRPQFFRLFGQNTQKLEEAKAQGAEEYLFHSQVDVMLKGDSWAQYLRQLSTVEANPVVKGFLPLLELGIAGILHYVGLMIRQLAAEKRYRDDTIPNIYVAGNASKILHWCGIGQYRTDSPVDTRLKTVFGRATDFRTLGKQRFEIRLSRAPKSEVAHGLLLDTREKTKATTLDIFAEEETHPALLSGEKYTIGASPHEWNEYIVQDHQLSDARVARDLPQLQSLLKSLKMEADPYLLSAIADAVNIKLEDAAGDPARHLEPPFVTALRELLRHKAEAWAALPLSEKERS